MRQITVRGSVCLPFVAGAVALVSSAHVASDGRCEPRYWAGDVAFVTQASYVEEAPADDAAVETRSTVSLPQPSPQTSDAAEPVVSMREAADAVNVPLRAAGSAAARPQSLRNDPLSPAANPHRAIQNRQPIGYSGGRFVRTTPASMPRRMTIQPAAPRPAVPRSQRLETASNRPTISPYLQLFGEEIDSQVVPNYYTYVRPQLEQQELNRRQQLELEQLERRQQGRPAAAGGAPSTTDDPNARNLPTRFMNTAQFYSGWQR